MTTGDMEQKKDAMDAAATKAAEELEALSDEQLQPLAGWFLENYRSSGWRRLGRILKSRMTDELAEGI